MYVTSVLVGLFGASLLTSTLAAPVPTAEPSAKAAASPEPLSTKAKSGLKTAGKVGLLATGVGAVGYGAFRGIRGLHRKHQGSQCKGGNMAACQKKARREMTREKKNLKSLKTTSSNAAGMPFDGPSSMSTSRLASAGGSGMMGAPKMMASAPSSGY